MTTATEAAVRDWGWNLEGRDDLVAIAWRAAKRCVDVWEGAPVARISAILPVGDLRDSSEALRRPRRLLEKSPSAASLRNETETLLLLQHRLAYPDGHGPHSYEHGSEWFGRYRFEYPPYELDSSNSPLWLCALSSSLHAFSAAMWTPDLVEPTNDELELEARREAGPIRATVEAVVCSFLARPCRELDELVTQISEGRDE